MKNIVHLNTNDVRGGAAKVARRLAEAQRRRASNASMLVGFRESDADWVQPFRLDRDFGSRCEEKGLLDYDWTGSDRLTELPIVRRADLVHAHNLHGGYFNPRSLVALSHAKPLLWTLHDMQAVTGHCAYSYDCHRWETGCGDCPSLSEYPAIYVDSTRRLWLDKREFYRQSVLYLVTPSVWLKRIVERSILGDHPVELIYNGVNTEIFRPHPREEIRRRLGLPPDVVVIGCVANGGSLGNKRKGGDVIVEAISHLQSKGINFRFVNIGQDSAFRGNDVVINTGYIVNEHQMAEWYSALDILLFPSLADNCPLVVSEAMACGVPLVTFATGGIPELVKDGVHGAVAPYLDTVGLIRRLETLAGDAELRNRMSAMCREDAVRRFDHERIVNQYEKVYERAVQHHAKIVKGRKKHMMPAPSIVPRLEKPIVGMIAVGDGDFSMKQSYPRMVRIEEPATSERLDEANVDLIWVPNPMLNPDSRLVETLVEHYRDEEIFYGDLVTYRKNGSLFYNTISPIIREEDGIFELDPALISLMVLKKSYFLEQIQQQDGLFRGGVMRARSVAGIHAALAKCGVERYLSYKLQNKEVQKFYIYGAGGHTADLLNQLESMSEKVLGIIDQDERKAGREFCGVKIYHVDQLPELPPACILISSASYEREICRNLSKRVPWKRIMRYYGEPN